ncbi:adenosine deaminase [soil metagenome]
MIVDREWVIGLPKAENHVHLEGCVDPLVLAQAAERSGGTVMPGPAHNLDELLEMNDHNCSLLTTADELSEAAFVRAATASALGIRYTDLIINPSHWPVWFDRLDQMLEALDAGFNRFEEDGHIRTGLLLSIGRHVDAATAVGIVDAVIRSTIPRVVGISIDGNESAPGAGLERFLPAVTAAKEHGLYVAIHTGESGGTDAIWPNLTLLAPDRIDHGVRSIDDPDLVAELARLGTTLCICPTSNLVLGIVPDLASHPIAALRSAGVSVSLNTDDPLVFGTDLPREYLIAAEAFDWTTQDLVGLARTSIETSAAPIELKATLLAELDAYPI